MITDRLEMSAETFYAGTGWEIKPEGACKGPVCVPLPDGFSAADAADRLGMAVVKDEHSGHVSFGPESLGGRALVTAEAPDVLLPDVDGNEFRLSSLRGKKVVVVAWAPY